MSSILFFKHHFSIKVIALIRADLESAIIPMSSANIITNIPGIWYRSSIRSFITTLKKKGEVLFPYGHPQLRFMVRLYSCILMNACDNSHLAIKNDFWWFLSTSPNFLISIWWSMLSNAFFKSNNAIQLHNFFCYLVCSKDIIRYKWTSEPYSGTNPS